tara:strand:+ start:990 stop:1181 length:192 start_codon:yes stop_codon:yes gene_type:complete
MTVKPGDLVEIIGSFSDDNPEVTSLLGTVIKPWSIPEWWVILSPDGELINWPEAQMSVINESR